MLHLITFQYHLMLLMIVLLRFPKRKLKNTIIQIKKILSKTLQEILSSFHLMLLHHLKMILLLKIQSPA